MADKTPITIDEFSGEYAWTVQIRQEDMVPFPELQIEDFFVIDPLQITFG
jgi:hypothetical protein